MNATQGLANPAWLSIFIHWAPPNELSRMVIGAGIGISAGAAFNFPVSGFVANNWGWESVFYVTGRKVHNIDVLF